jgi:hypothetical protein
MSDVDQDKIDTKPPPSREKKRSAWSWPRCVVAGIGTGIFVGGVLLVDARRVAVAVVLILIALVWRR